MEQEMKLPKKDLELFYRLHPSLLLYTNQRLKKVSDVSTLEDFLELSIEEKVKIRNGLCNHLELLDSFIVENPFNFSPEELEIVAGWKHLVRGTFYLLHYLKKYAVLLEDKREPRVYGVVALTNTFEEILGPRLPIMLETVLLPFKGQITYDGFMNLYSISFGKGIRTDLEDAYQESKSKFGIITSIPPRIEKLEQSDADRLRCYLRSENSRERHWREIEELVKKDPSLMILYHHEMGKIHARAYGKKLREIGLGDAWFAILEGTLVASGATEDQVKQILKDILPIEKRRLTYLFHLKRM